MGKKLSKSSECFINGYDENSSKGYFLEVDVEHPKICLIFMAIYHFY